MLLDGEEVRFSSPQAARRAGISAVYQELSLVPDMTVAENVWLANEPVALGRVRRKERKERTARLLSLRGRSGSLGRTRSYRTSRPATDRSWRSSRP